VRLHPSRSGNDARSDRRLCLPLLRRYVQDVVAANEGVAVLRLHGERMHIGTTTRVHSSSARAAFTRAYMRREVLGAMHGTCEESASHRTASSCPPALLAASSLRTFSCPSTYSSVCSSATFMYPSKHASTPRYETPLFSLTMTGRPSTDWRKSLGVFFAVTPAAAAPAPTPRDIAEEEGGATGERSTGRAEERGDECGRRAALQRRSTRACTSDPSIDIYA
jgi:hypothetical protein